MQAAYMNEVQGIKLIINVGKCCTGTRHREGAALIRICMVSHAVSIRIKQLKTNPFHKGVNIYLRVTKTKGHSPLPLIKM